MNEEESIFLLKLLEQLTINPASPNALETVNLVQTIINKLKQNGLQIKDK